MGEHTDTEAAGTASGLPLLREAWKAANGGTDVVISDLARDSGVGRSTLFAWLCGEVEPTASAWAAVCRTLVADPVALWLAAGGEDRGMLWAERMRHGWSAGQLAAKAAVSKRTVLCAEAGEPVRSDAAARLARTLSVPLLVAVLTPAPRARSRVGTLLEQARVSAGLSRTEFAVRLGVSRQLLTAWCSGSELLPEARVGSVADGAGVDRQMVAWARAADRQLVTT